MGFILFGVTEYIWIPSVRFLSSIIGLILGIVSLRQISKNSELTGKRLGIIGVILCALNVLLPLLMIPIGMLMYFS